MSSKFVLHSRKRALGENRAPRDRDYIAEPYENHPRNLGPSWKAGVPVDDEDYLYENQLGAGYAPDPNEAE